MRLIRRCACADAWRELSERAGDWRLACDTPSPGPGSACIIAPVTIIHFNYSRRPSTSYYVYIVIDTSMFNNCSSDMLRIVYSSLFFFHHRSTVWCHSLKKTTVRSDHLKHASGPFIKCIMFSSAHTQGNTKKKISQLKMERSKSIKKWIAELITRDKQITTGYKYVLLGVESAHRTLSPKLWPIKS